jgi:hypothetical protein
VIPENASQHDDKTNQEIAVKKQIDPKIDRNGEPCLEDSKWPVGEHKVFSKNEVVFVSKVDGDVPGGVEAGDRLVVKKRRPDQEKKN